MIQCTYCALIHLQYNRMAIGVLATISILSHNYHFFQCQEQLKSSLLGSLMFIIQFCTVCQVSKSYLFTSCRFFSFKHLSHSPTPQALKSTILLCFYDFCYLFDQEVQDFSTLLASCKTALGIVYLCRLSIQSAFVLMLFLLVSVSSSTLVVFPANVFSKLSSLPIPILEVLDLFVLHR